MTTMTTTAGTTTGTKTGRGARVALWVLQVLLVGVYLAAASGKVAADPGVIAGFAAMGISATGTVTIGVLELLGAVGLLIPRIAGLAATALSALMIGAVVTTAAAGGGALTMIPAVVLVLVGVVAWTRRHETAALVRHPRRTLLGG